MDRVQKLLMRYNKSDKAIEIGPGYNPLLSKKEGHPVVFVDHTDRQGLIDKYTQIGVDTSRIEEIDIVWTGEPLDELVRNSFPGIQFDYCIASHVLEHIPDPIRFFSAIASLLKDRGICSLAIPDKRYCFDLLQNPSTTVDLVLAYERVARTHSRRELFQMKAYAVKNGEDIVWTQGAKLKNLNFMGSDFLATFSEFHGSDDANEKPYEDCHAWRYTPSSFALIVLELQALGRLQFVIDSLFPTDGCEFIVVLRKEVPSPLSPAELSERRMALLIELQRELATGGEFFT